MQNTAGKPSSPMLILSITIAGIFLAEIVAMVVVYFIDPHSYLITTLIDGLIMVTLIFPLLYFFIFRRLVHQLMEQTRAEHALHQSVEVFERMFSVTHVLFAYLDRDFNFVRVNRAYATSAGQTVEFYPGKNHFDLFPNDDNRAIFQKVVDTGEPVFIKDKVFVYAEHPEWGETYWDWSLVPVKHKNGRVTGLILALIDRTPEKLAQMAEMESQRRFQAIFNQSFQLIALFRPDGEVIEINQTAVQVLGVDPSHLIGKTLWEAAGPAYPQSSREIVQSGIAAAAAGEVIRSEGMLINAQGEPIAVDFSIKPVVDDQGQPILLIGEARDITERKKAQAALEHSYLEMQKLARVEEEQRQLAEGLAQATLAVNASTPLDEVLLRIMDQIHKIIPFNIGDISLVEGGEVRAVQTFNFESYPEARDLIGDGTRMGEFPLYRRILTTGHALVVNCIAQEPDWRPVQGVEWAASYIGVPLLSEGGVIGVMDLISSQEGFFSDIICQRLNAFAAAVALAIQNAKLYQGERAARQTAEVLSKASRALTQTLELDEVLAILLEYLQQLIPFDSAQVVLLEDDRNFSVRAAIPAVSEEFGSAMQPVTRYPYLAEMIACERPLLIRDTASYPAWRHVLDLAQTRNWMGVPVAAGGSSIGFACIDCYHPGCFTNEHRRLAEALVGQAAAAIQNAWLFEQVRTGSERLQSLSHRLVEVQESERRYIARELHDEAGQALASVTVMLQLIENNANDPNYVIHKAAEIGSGLERVLQNLHHLATALRPATLDHLGLEAALRQYLDGVRETYGLNVQYRVVGLTDRLPAEVETALYRICQEAVTNIIRHAKATRVDLLLQPRQSKLVLVIEDDGIGFDPATVHSSGRLGILGIHERVEMLGGELTIESEPGKGTTLVVELPYDYQDHHR